MPGTLTCPECQTSLRVREDMVGRNIKCPRCGTTVAVSSSAFSARPEVAARPLRNSPARSSGPQGKRACPACGEPISQAARQCHHCHAQLDEEEEDGPRRGAARFEPCPRCGETGARRVKWTFWGSFYGPALFTHVRCPGCGTTYNGRTGRSNLVPAIAFVTVSLLLLLALFGIIALLLMTKGLL